MKKISFIWTFIGFLLVLTACSDKNDIEYDSGSDIIVSKPEVVFRLRQFGCGCKERILL